MRIDVHMINMGAAAALEKHIKSRLALALRRHAARIAWVGVWLVDHAGEPEARRRACRIDAWLSGAGHVAVRHADADARTAADLAMARLELAIARRLRAAGSPTQGSAHQHDGPDWQAKHVWENEGGRTPASERSPVPESGQAWEVAIQHTRGARTRSLRRRRTSPPLGARTCRMLSSTRQERAV